MSFEGYGDPSTWKPTIIYLCKNDPRALWYGLQFVKWRDMMGRSGDVPDSHREPYPYPLKECKCEGCKDEVDFQKRIAIKSMG